VGDDPRGRHDQPIASFGEFVGGDHQPRRGGERVAPLAARRRTGVIGTAAQLHLEPEPGDERAGQAHRGAGAGDRGALVDVHLDKAREPGQPRRRRPHLRRMDARGAQRLAQRHPALIAALEHLRQVEPAREGPAAERRRVEASALLVGEGEDRDRALGCDLKRARQAQRTVETAALANAVEV